MSEESSEPEEIERDPAGETSLWVRQAIEGDAPSLEWIVAKFTPLLLASAKYRISPMLQRICDPEDLVNDAWLVLLPKLASLSPRDGRFTPVLLKFLTTTIVQQLNNQMKKQIRRQARNIAGDDSDGASGLPIEASWTGVVTRVVNKERSEAVTRSLEKLAADDFELLVLRGIEGQPYRDIAAVTGGDPKSLAVKYSRALDKLRRELPGSIFSELIDE